MTGMMPDSGVPPQDARNSILDPNTINCDELWYSTSRCQPRFDPAAANAVLSELINAINCSGIPYDCSKLDNLCTAIGYMIQGGDAWCAPLTGGASDYLGNLQPPLLAYPAADCCMALKVIPNVNNTGAIRLNIDNLGFVPVVRNNNTPMQKDDWKAGIPTMVIYCNGRFVQLGLVDSQLPPGPLNHAVDLWVNNAYGNDSNDGLSDAPGHALLTFQRAINLAFGYTPGPYPVTIHIMVGTYAGGVTPTYPGPALSVVGTGPGTMIDGGAGYAFAVSGPNNATIRDVATRNSAALGTGGNIVCSSGASITANRIYSYGVGGAHLQAGAGFLSVTNHTVYGNCYCAYWANFGGSMSYGGNNAVAQAINMTLTYAFAAGGGSMGVPGGTPQYSGSAFAIGTKYLCELNGVINDQSSFNPWFPGTLAGGTAHGGQYV
jgi:hypothetical protein